MKKIIIFGSSGLFGKNLQHRLSKDKYNLILHSRNNNSNLSFNLFDQKEIEKCLNLHEPDVVINLVAITDVDHCESNPKEAYLSNSLIPHNIAQSIINVNKDIYLIQFSTDHLYDSASPSKEGDVIIKNSYALSKFCGDMAVLQYPKSIVMRTNFFGKSIQNTRYSFSDWIFNSLSDKIKIKLLNDVFFSPLSINTLIRIIENLIHQKPTGIFNVGSRSGFSKADFGVMFAKKLNLNLNLIESISYKEANFYNANRPLDMRMNVTKYEDFFNETLPVLEEEIFLVVKDYLID